MLFVVVVGGVVGVVVVVGGGVGVGVVGVVVVVGRGRGGGGGVGVGVVVVVGGGVCMPRRITGSTSLDCWKTVSGNGTS